MDKKTNYSVARVETYTKTSITKAERHNERKNKSYSNMNVDLEQTPNNVHYKRCETTYNEKLKEMLDSGQVSLRGLRANAKLFDELIFDINSDYFEKHGGYEFAKEFYERAFHFAEQEMGTDNIISAVMHADELNTALTAEYGKPIYHYHLHVVALPVVKKEVKWTKKCKDKSSYSAEQLGHIINSCFCIFNFSLILFLFLSIKFIIKHTNTNAIIDIIKIPIIFSYLILKLSIILLNTVISSP